MKKNMHTDGSRLPTDVLVSINLELSGDELDPDNISIYLGCVPTKSWKRGDVKFIGNNKKKFIYSWGGWILEATDISLENMNDSILLLIDKSGIDRYEISSLIPSGISAQIDISIFGDLSTPITILPIVFEKLKHSGIPICFNYFG